MSTAPCTHAFTAGRDLTLTGLHSGREEVWEERPRRRVLQQKSARASCRIHRPACLTPVTVWDQWSHRQAPPALNDTDNNALLRRHREGRQVCRGIT